MALAPGKTYSLRLGNARYPFMKLVLQEHLVEGEYFLSVDTHDQMFETDDPAEQHALVALRRANFEIKDAVESAWGAAGLPTARHVKGLVEGWPAPPVTGDPSDSPIFNRAVQGVYELGSTFKIFAVAQALELGLVTPDTMIDTRAPLVQGRWLRPGSHLDLIGSFTPAMREADDACLAGAVLCVDTEEALLKSGDLLGPLSRGVFVAGDVRATLTTLARGQASGRRTASERTVFKSVGTALEDLAAAIQVYESP